MHLHTFRLPLSDSLLTSSQLNLSFCFSALSHLHYRFILSSWAAAQSKSLPNFYCLSWGFSASVTLYKINELSIVNIFFSFFSDGAILQTEPASSIHLMLTVITSLRGMKKCSRDAPLFESRDAPTRRPHDAHGNRPPSRYFSPEFTPR